MKTTKFLVIIIILMMYLSVNQSCNKEETSLDLSSSKVLISPNGEMLLNSLDELHSIVKNDILESFNDSKDYKITKIEFLKGLSKGCAAMITYKLNDGKIRNFALNKNVNFDLKGAVISNKILSGIKSEAVYRVKCLGNGGCPTEQCFAQAVITIPPEGGSTIKYSCSCAECILEVTTPE